MIKNKKNGFTLVELLAVIVILAIILVIAVPKVMDVIKDSKKATLESTAKMIASSAEKAKVQNTILGKTEKLECESVAKINDIDYSSCDIEFDGNIAKVTISGSGKFEGLHVCSGTKSNATATSNSCIVSILTVNLDGGNDNNTQYNTKYDAGSTVTLTVPTKEYFEFKGWVIVSGTDASVEGNTLTIGKTDTEVKAVWEDTRSFISTTIGESSRSKIGYTGEEGEELNIPDVFYDEANGKWYKVTSIGANAFKNCTNLASITIPDSVTSIGSSAFKNCSNLTSITIPNSVTSIGDSAFYGCSNLTSITIPDGVTSIGNSAFYFCTNLTSITIPDSVTSIGANAFRYSDLTSITIPNGVTSISDYTFSGCENLTSVTIPDSVTSIGEDAFAQCENLTSIAIPNGVTSIGEGAFSGCEKLTSITIPNSVTSIGKEAFSTCRGLTSMEIPNGVTSIGNQTFYGCNNLKKIIIPNSVTSIGTGAFQSTSFTSITIPNSVTSIGDSAFSGCDKLTSITIPNSVISIGANAFRNCSKLTDVYYTGKAEEWNSITIDSTNTYLINATKHYESVVE